MERGFTLIEMMIVLVIMAILVTLAAPAFTDAVLGSRLGTHANALVASAHLARGEAIKRNAAVTMCVSSNGTSCGTGDWEQGWIILIGTTVIHREQALPTGFKIIENSGTPLTSLSFQPTGVGATQSSFTVCRATPTVGSQERLVTLSATGRPTVSTPSITSSCS